MANTLYNEGISKWFSGDLDWDADTVKFMLLDNTYVVDPDHTYADLVGELIAGNGYTTGGIDLTGRVVEKDDVNNLAVLKVDNPTFNSITANPQQGIIYFDFGATKVLFLHIQDGFPQSPVNCDLILTFPNNSPLVMKQGTI